MKYTFDKPPALNKLYATNKYGSKYLKAEGVAWREKALWQIKVTRPVMLTDNLSLTVHLFTCRHQDNDSILKLLQDTLQLAGVYKDDYLIFELHVFKHKCSIKDEKIEVEVVPLDKGSLV